MPHRPPNRAVRSARGPSAGVRVHRQGSRAQGRAAARTRGGVGGLPRLLPHGGVAVCEGGPRVPALHARPPWLHAKLATAYAERGNYACAAANVEEALHAGRAGTVDREAVLAEWSRRLEVLGGRRKRKRRPPRHRRSALAPERVRVNRIRRFRRARRARRSVSSGPARTQDWRVANWSGERGVVQSSRRQQTGPQPARNAASASTGK